MESEIAPTRRLVLPSRESPDFHSEAISSTIKAPGRRGTSNPTGIVERDEEPVMRSAKKRGRTSTQPPPREDSNVRGGQRIVAGVNLGAEDGTRIDYSLIDQAMLGKTKLEAAG